MSAFFTVLPRWTNHSHVFFVPYYFYFFITSRPNKRGAGVEFGEDVVNAFLKQNKVGTSVSGFSLR
jgi:hypothetical protein